MSNEEMRIAIATVCGWTEIHKRHSSGKWVGKHSSKTERGFPILCELPNYPGSLDAMHEAKKHLTREQRLDYAEFLIENLADEFCDLAGTREHIYACNTFTAEQEARAFLRAVGRWQEKEKGV